MLTYEQLDEIKTRASKATAGPWDWNSRHGLGAPNRLVMWPSHEYGCDLDIEGEEADLDFIANARTDIPALIAALEASEAARVKAEQERDALKEALKPFADEAFRYEPDDGDSDLPIWDCQLTLGNLRDARRTLEAKL